MKKLLILLSIVLVTGLSFPTFGQDTIPTVEIHHIDVGHGDATLINVRDSMGAIQHSILIDAGDRNHANEVRNYLNVNAKKVADTVHLDFILASHFHEDHIGGLVGKEKPYLDTIITLDTIFGMNTTSLGTPGPTVITKIDTVVTIDTVPYRTGILADSIVRYFAVLDKGFDPPIPDPTTKAYFSHYLDLNTKSKRHIKVGGQCNGTNRFLIPSTEYPPRAVDTVGGGLCLGGVIELGEDKNGIPINLRLVLADAEVYIPGKGIIDKAEILDIKRKTPGAFFNENNWGLAWVLEYGAFKYFTGGDMGGYTPYSKKLAIRPARGSAPSRRRPTRKPKPRENAACNDCTAYFNLENPVADALKKLYNDSTDIKGHICAFKVNHHGSCCSTNNYFLKTLRPSLAVLSMGVKHHHPNEPLIERLQKLEWTESPLYRETELFKYFMTTLDEHDREFDLEKGETSGSNSLVATTITLDTISIDSLWLTPNGETLYSMKPYKPVGDVVIEVFPELNNIPINHQSQFKVVFFQPWLDPNVYNNDTANPTIFYSVQCHRER